MTASMMDQKVVDTSSVDRYINGEFATNLTRLLGKIERGDISAWKEFSSYADWVTAEKGETYSIACAELSRRDPTFYLRRYLAGDTGSVVCANRGYGWSGCIGRSVQDAVYAERLYIAADAAERHQIQAFISKVAVWKDNKG